MCLIGILSSCGASAAQLGGPAAPLPTFDQVRPSSPAKVWIIEPKNGQVIHGTSMIISIGLSGATMSPIITTHISPTLGHVHLFLNNVLTYMNYELIRFIPIKPGTYTMRAEFVAQDHLPFNPPVFTPTIHFTVAPS